MDAKAEHHIDWEGWEATDVATLLFVIQRGQALLIRKLRGLGAGKINAPGGRVEAGESLEAAAIRETVEEVGVRPIAPRLRGRLRFAFVDGYHLECHVFTSDSFEGEVRPSDEAIPMWVGLEALPYDEMWADDALWVPRMLSGWTPFDGRFVFDGERMVTADLDCHDPAQALFERLAGLGIATRTVHHPPVFTVAQAQAVRASGGEIHTRNLFVRDKSGRMFLVTVEESRPVDLRGLAETLGVRNLSFGSAERLRTHLGVEPGSVTPLAALNDRVGKVTLVLDKALAEAHAVHCHPLTNDRTTSIAGPELLRFLVDTGHPPVLI